MLPDISEGLSAELGRRIQPTFGYYRQPNGWITVSPNTRLERLKYTEEGWEYLEHYGAFDMTGYSINHPLEGLFMFGGAKELPVEQVVQMGFYIDPPLVPRCQQHLTQYHRAHRQECWRGAKKVVFPQLDGVAVAGPFVCDFCGRKMPTQKARDQHQEVMHATPMNNIQLGRSLGDTLGGILGQGRTAPVAVATPVAAAMPDNAGLLQELEALKKYKTKVEEDRARMARMRALRGKKQ